MYSGKEIVVVGEESMLPRYNILLIFIIPVVVAHSWFEDQWLHACKKGRVHRIRAMNCDSLGREGMRKSLHSCHNDKTLATIIRRCPHLLPRGYDFDKQAQHLYSHRMVRSFRTLIANGRCQEMGEDSMRQLLTSFVDSNSVKFVRAMVRHCLIGDQAWRQFVEQAERQGRSELLIVVKEEERQQRHGPVLFSGPKYRHEAYVRTFPSGRQIVIERERGFANNRNPLPSPSPPNYMANNYPQPQPQPAPPPQQVPPQQVPPQPQPTSAMAGNIIGTYDGPIVDVSSQEVLQNLSILAQLTPHQALRFGMLSDGCMGLSEAHFRQPGVSSETVANLPVQCFQRIPPPAFAGLSPRMVARIKWWPYVTRDQIRYVPTGDAIRSLPFDQLGQGRQRDGEDRVHPCWTITQEQLKSIRQSSNVKKEYDRRCVRSSAPTIKIGGGIFAGIVLVSLGLLL